MTLVNNSGYSLRVGLANALVFVWVLGLVNWLMYPRGGAEALLCLLAFAVIGLAAWIAPIGPRGLRCAGDCSCSSCRRCRRGARRGRSAGFGDPHLWLAPGAPDASYGRLSPQPGGVIPGRAHLVTGQLKARG